MRRVASGLAAIVVAALGSPGVAAAGLVPTNDEIASGRGFSASGIATDSTGNTLVAWSQQTSESGPREVMIRSVSATGSLGPIQNLTPAGRIGRDPGVAMSPSGRAFVAWPDAGDGDDPTGVTGRWIGAGGELGPPLTLIAGEKDITDASSVLVDVDLAGVATVIWRNGNEGVGLRRVQPDGTLAALLPDITGGASVLDSSLGDLPSGDTVVVWDGNGIELVVVTSASTFGAPTTISSTNSVTDLDLAVDAAGSGLATWREDGATENAIIGRLLTPGGAPSGEPLTIDPFQAPFGDSPAVAVDSIGDFLVTWTRQDSASDGIVQARGVNSAGVFAGLPQPISSAGVRGSVPEPLIGDNGFGAAIWGSMAPGESSTTLGRVVGSGGNPTGGIEQIIGSSRINRAMAAGVPASNFGAFLLEYPIDGAHNAASVRRMMAAPVCANSSAGVLQGRTIPFHIACNGMGIENARILTPPKNGRVGKFLPEFDVKGEVKSGSEFGYTPNRKFIGTDEFTYVAINDGGESNVATATIRVRKDRTRPTITGLRLAHGKARKSKPPILTYWFILRSDEPTRSVVTVEKRVRGVRKGSNRYRKLGKVSAKAFTEQAKLVIRGRLDRAISPGGRFRATAVATDLGDNRSAPRKRIVKFIEKRPSGRR